MATLIVDCVSVAVAFIPEGLPVALTAGLTITANLMKKNKILCKSLKTVETLGSVSVVCSDKTGTLTEVSFTTMPLARCYSNTLQGKMTVSECTLGMESMSVDKACSSIPFSRTIANAIGQLRSIAALCNAAELDAAGSHLPLAERKIFGDATDQAILRFAERLQAGCVAYLRACWMKTFELAFNSKNKFMIRCFAITRPECLPETFGGVGLNTFGDKDMLVDRGD